MGEKEHKALQVVIEKNARPNVASSGDFDEKKFMDAEWQRLADFYDVTVEELQSPQFEAKQHAEEEQRRKAQEAERKVFERKDIKVSIAVLVMASFLLFPFAGWYAFAAAAVAAYNYGGLSWEIRDERMDRRELAWTAVARTAVALFAAAMAVALWMKK